ncbi:hypothetical protein K1X12_00330 [Hyphomonas sp. WL0036]|uniref:hypothetical protein n=1 Tax=Hyphomonas sediminis TaxID=2866160 RepID=UPI001C7FF7CB|nr:hypothetical protein [Hyphomonas sediminis]MBY9065321.1 hypothetical protein [Hyphomonas sediminis]
MAALFDAYIMVDWSAASKPSLGANSIWIGILAKDARLKLQYRGVNIDTRLKARAFIEDMVAKLTKRGDKVLIGFDFALGFPAGTAAALGLDTSAQAPWAAMYAHLATKMKEKPDNSNARYAIAAGMNYAISKGPFPFWGAPTRDVVSTLAATRPEFEGAALAEHRHCENYLKENKIGQPKSVWQLAYAGSVGSQTLTGIPHVHALRQAWPTSRVWPFELGTEPLTRDALEGISVVMAEIYPALVKAKPEKGEVADEAQVRQIARHYADLDEKGTLAASFSTAKSLSPEQNRDVAEEEGWILGV